MKLISTYTQNRGYFDNTCLYRKSEQNEYSRVSNTCNLPNSHTPWKINQNQINILPGKPNEIKKKPSKLCSCKCLNLPISKTLVKKSKFNKCTVPNKDIPPGKILKINKHTSMFIWNSRVNKWNLKNLKRIIQTLDRYKTK